MSIRRDGFYINFVEPADPLLVKQAIPFEFQCLLFARICMSSVMYFILPYIMIICFRRMVLYKETWYISSLPIESHVNYDMI